MKRSLLFGVITLCSLSANTQTTTEGFESLGIELDTFRNGSDMSGGFNFEPIVLPNTYDTAFGGSWSGFSISTMRDDSTAGFANQYSAITGSGFNSDIYAVAYPPFMGNLELRIDPLLDQSIQLESMRVTNSTYTYLSMKDGDAFAKKFGGATGNDPDFLNLHTVLLVGAVPVDTISFPLADYTYNDNNFDYLLNTWGFVDLTEFETTISDTSALRFYFTSSDTAFGFINTPTYFCLDDLKFSVILGLNELNSDIQEFSIIHVAGGVEITSSVNGHLLIYDMSGKTIAVDRFSAGENHYSFDHVSTGWHIVHVEGRYQSHSLKVFIP